MLENCSENTEISSWLFSKLVLTHNAVFETVLTGTTTRLELSIDILFVSKFVVYCPGWILQFALFLWNLHSVLLNLEQICLPLPCAFLHDIWLLLNSFEQAFDWYKVLEFWCLIRLSIGHNLHPLCLLLPQLCTKTVCVVLICFEQCLACLKAD